MAAPMIEAAIVKIREMISSGELRPGEKLPPEPELAAMLGMSRNTAREAVRALITARVLDVRRGSGTYVTSLRPELLLEGIGFAVDLLQDDSVLELVDIRMMLEPAASALAAQRITPAQLAELRATLDRMVAHRDDPEKLVQHDAEFHSQVVAATGNHTLTTVLDALSGRTLRARVWRGLHESRSSDRTIAEHTQIYTALASGDASLAEAAARLHVSTTREWLRSRAAEPENPAGSTGAAS